MHGCFAGTLQVMNQGADLGSGGSVRCGSTLMSQYIEAVSVTKHKQEGDIETDGEWQAPNGHLTGRSSPAGLNSRDLEFISKFGQEYPEDHLRQLVHSVAPSISGHTLVKAGMLLALTGGIQKNAESKGKVPIRGNIHLLLVGEPGIGKSQLLKAIAAVAPR